MLVAPGWGRDAEWVCGEEHNHPLSMVQLLFSYTNYMPDARRGNIARAALYKEGLGVELDGAGVELDGAGVLSDV